MILFNNVTNGEFYMFRTKILLGIFALTFIVQTHCMESIAETSLDDLKVLIKDYSKKAVEEALSKTIKDQSPSSFSSGIKFISGQPLVQTFAYSALIATILGIAFSRSKYCWITPKSFDDLLQKKEQKFVEVVIQAKELVEESQKNMLFEYTKNFNGIQAGIAAIRGNVKKSKEEVEDIYTSALEAELKRRKELFNKSIIALRFHEAGFERIERSLKMLAIDAAETEEIFLEKLNEHESEIDTSRESINNEFEKEYSESSNAHNEEVASLQNLRENQSYNHESLLSMVCQTEFMAKVLKKSLSTKIKEPEALSTAYSHLENLTLLIDQLEALQNSN